MSFPDLLPPPRVAPKLSTSTRLFLLAYSLCLALFFALIITSLPPLPFPRPPPADLCTFAPKLDLTLPLCDGVPRTLVPLLPLAEAALCDANFAITFDREIRGFLPVSDLCLFEPTLVETELSASLISPISDTTCRVKPEPLVTEHTDDPTSGLFAGFVETRVRSRPLGYS